MSSEQPRTLDILTEVGRIMPDLADQDPQDRRAVDGQILQTAAMLPQADLEAIWIWVEARRNTDPEAWLGEWQAMREQLFSQWLIQMGQTFAQVADGHEEQ